MADYWIRERAKTPAGFFSADELDDVQRFYTGAPATPLRHLPALADSLGVADVLVKDETARFGLPAFKVLGVRYAVAKLLARDDGRITNVTCATAGNHGRAVARVARECGLDAHIYVPIGTPPASIAALRAESAHVIVTSVDYDETVRVMADDAGEEGWTIVSDTAWEDYEDIPRWIMGGYTQLMNEAAGQWDAPPDVVLVQAGVGSLAGAVAGWLDATFGDGGPALVIVEPEGSPCVLASLQSGKRIDLAMCAPTAMTGLRSGVVSPLAWRVIHRRADAALTISEDVCRQAMSRLATPMGKDPAIAAGPSGAAGVAALLALSSGRSLKELRRALDINRHTRALTIVTESKG